MNLESELIDILDQLQRSLQSLISKARHEQLHSSPVERPSGHVAVLATGVRYHWLCDYAKRAGSRDWYDTAEEAEAAGFSACPHCRLKARITATKAS